MRRITIPRHRAPVGWFCGALAALSMAVPAHSQHVIHPAASVRVAEVMDEHQGRIVRVTLDDLRPAEILRIQVELSAGGYDPGEINGFLGRETRRALRRFQTARGLGICGCPSYETIVALGITQTIVRYSWSDARFVSLRTRTYRSVGDRPGFPRSGGYGRRPGPRGPAVVVGHEPVWGQGQIERRFGRRDRGKRHAGKARIVEPPRPRPGGPIRPGLRTRPQPRNAPPQGASRGVSSSLRGNGLSRRSHATPSKISPPPR